MEHTIIQESVPCKFGDDHRITVILNPDMTLGSISTTCCAEAKEETRGLILLGTDPMETCYGYMDSFLEHVRGEKARHALPFEYQTTLLSYLGEKVRDRIVVKKSQRDKEDKAKREAQKNERDNTFAAQKFIELIRLQLGSLADQFIIRKEEDGTYSFLVRTKMGSGWKVATRRKGVWEVPKMWSKYAGDEMYHAAFDEISFRSGKYEDGKDCIFCGAKAYKGHEYTPRHQREVSKAIFIAMQRCSAEGAKIIRDNVTDKQGNPVQFGYRANSKRLIGVRYVAE